MRKNIRTIAATAISVCLALTGCGGGNNAETTAQNQTGVNAPTGAASTVTPGGATTTTQAGQTGTAAHTAVNPYSVDDIRASVEPSAFLPPRLDAEHSLPIPEGDNQYNTCDDWLEMVDGSGKHLYYCDYKGEKLLGGQEILSLYKLKNSRYYRYSVESADGGIHDGLMDGQANVLIPADDSVSIIDELQGDRFVIVYTFDKATDNADEAVYKTASSGMYAGTAKIYDLQNRRYVEKLTTTKLPAFHVHGDIIFNNMVNQEQQKMVYVTVEDDTVHELDLAYSFVGDRLIVRRDFSKGIFEVYDHDMNLLFTTPYEVTEMAGTSDFYNIALPDNSSNPKGVVHYSGTIIAEPIYKSISYSTGEIFYFNTNDNSKYGFLDASGKTVKTQKYDSVWSTGLPGYTIGNYDDGTRDLLDAHGQALLVGGRFECITAKNHSYLPYNSLFYLFINEDNAACVYIVNTAGLNLGGIKDYDYFGDFLLYDMGNNVLYDLVTGDTLLKDIIKAYTAYGYVYVEKQGIITAYKVQTETPILK